MSHNIAKGAIQLVEQSDEISAANRVYRSQLESGNSSQSALVLATIVYLQRNPRVPQAVARACVAAAIGAMALKRALPLRPQPRPVAATPPAFYVTRHWSRHWVRAEFALRPGGHHGDNRENAERRSARG